jgi:hypothetical protein
VSTDVNSVSNNKSTAVDNQGENVDRVAEKNERAKRDRVPVKQVYEPVDLI